MRYKLIQGAHYRWIIVKSDDYDLAWSGARWVPHKNGIPTGGIQICNFDDRAEAQKYASAHPKLM
jgi:hypothetical protein